MNPILSLALSQLFGIALDAGDELALEQFERVIQDRRDNVLANDERDGWTNEKAADSKNDFPGDALAKRIDNFFFLYGKSLPGKGTDFIRDFLSARHTPTLRAQVDATATREELADLVGEAILADVAAAIEAAKQAA